MAAVTRRGTFLETATYPQPRPWITPGLPEWITMILADWIILAAVGLPVIAILALLVQRVR